MFFAFSSDCISVPVRPHLIVDIIFPQQFTTLTHLTHIIHLLILVENLYSDLFEVGPFRAHKKLGEVCNRRSLLSFHFI